MSTIPNMNYDMSGVGFAYERFGQSLNDLFAPSLPKYVIVPAGFMAERQAAHQGQAARRQRLLPRHRRPRWKGIGR